MKKDRIIRLICNMLVSIAILLAPIISDSCRIIWYQPEEPEGFKDFVNNLKRNKE